MLTGGSFLGPLRSICLRIDCKSIPQFCSVPCVEAHSSISYPFSIFYIYFSLYIYTVLDLSPSLPIYIPVYCTGCVEDDDIEEGEYIDTDTEEEEKAPVQPESQECITLIDLLPSKLRGTCASKLWFASRSKFHYYILVKSDLILH